jgi:hypothetical protein
MHRHFYYGPGTHYATTTESDDEDESNQFDFPAPSFSQGDDVPDRMIPRASWRGLGKYKKLVT